MSVPYEPVAKGRGRASNYQRKGKKLVRLNRPIVYTPAKTKTFESQVKEFLTVTQRQKPVTGPIEVEVCFYLPRPKSVKRIYPSVKPDVDNFMKSFFDACNGVLWEDDSQIVVAHAHKLYADESIFPSIRLSYRTLVE